MAADNSRRDSLFCEAIEIVSAETRAAYVARACGGDAALRLEVERLIGAHFQTTGVLDRPLVDSIGVGNLRAHLKEHSPSLQSTTTAEIGLVIAGRYDLLEKIGEGGMGEVWLARQSEPVKRNVALKLIRPGVNTPQVLGRLEAERQALAVMDHPNIAKVLDGGVTDDGRPFFAMELVKGVPITEYCDALQLTPAERLELFVPVCNAIQHAHQKGIIHRDIKPSNVLVARYDDRAVPKVIDFGVAKAVGQPLTEHSIHTAFGGIVGTPLYMSPEQATLNNLDIDTRSDVYSLGVLLYELLTGNPPFWLKELEKQGMLEILRAVREEEPVKPSTRLNTDDTLATLSANRGTEPRKLTALLRTDLDWIVLKALEKDRSRRYQSAGSFAADVVSYLNGDPVLAHPPSRRYRLHKFLRRHRGPVAAGLAVTAALLVGLAAFAWQARVARLERDGAVAARLETKQRADELQKVSDFQARMLSQVDSTAAGLQLTRDVKAKLAAELARSGASEADRAKELDAFAGEWSRINATDAARDLIDRTILKPAVEAVDKQFADQPLVDATLRQVLASRYRELGLFDVAFSLQERVLATRRRLLGDDHPDTIGSIEATGILFQEKGQFKEAEQLYRELLERRRSVLGDDHVDSLVAMGYIGDVLKAQGKLTEADAFTRDALEKRRRALGEEHPLTLSSLHEMGSLLRAEGKHAEAEQFLREALAKRRRVLGDDHRDTLQTLDSLGVALNLENERSEATQCLREALEKRRRILGETHPDTLSTRRNLATTFSMSGKRSEAEAVFRDALTTEQALLGADHPNSLLTLNNLAVALVEQGKLAEAEPMCRELLERRRRTAGADHPNTLMATNVLGFVLRRENKPGEAEPYVRQALDVARRTLGADHPDTLIYLHNLGMLLRDQNKLQEAELYLRDVVAKARQKLGPEHITTLVSATSLGGLLVEEKHFQEAIDLLAPAEATTRKFCTGANVRTLALLLLNLGKARAAQHDYAVAETKLLEAQPLFVKTRGPAHKETLACTQTVVDLYTAWHVADPSKGHDVKAAEWKSKLAAAPPAPAGKEF